MCGKCQFHVCMDDTEILPNLNVILGWEKVPVSAAPSTENFLTLSVMGYYQNLRPWGVRALWDAQVPYKTANTH